MTKFAFIYRDFTKLAFDLCFCSAHCLKNNLKKKSKKIYILTHLIRAHQFHRFVTKFTYDVDFKKK